VIVRIQSRDDTALYLGDAIVHERNVEYPSGYAPSTSTRSRPWGPRMLLERCRAIEGDRHGFPPTRSVRIERDGRGDRSVPTTDLHRRAVHS
jgi:hypothetical protein